MPLYSEIEAYLSSMEALESWTLNFFQLVDVQDGDKQIVICDDFKVLQPYQEYFLCFMTAHTTVSISTSLWHMWLDLQKGVLYVQL